LPNYPGFLLAILPPGAFLLLGLLIAGKNQLDVRAIERANAQRSPVEAAQSRRVRVTGVIE
jgi:electron transport complex protein RnfE